MSRLVKMLSEFAKTKHDELNMWTDILHQCLSDDEYEWLIDCYSGTSGQSIIINLQSWPTVLRYVTTQDALKYIESDIWDVNEYLGCMHRVDNGNYLVQLTPLIVYGLMLNKGCTNITVTYTKEFQDIVTRLWNFIERCDGRVSVEQVIHKAKLLIKYKVKAC
jgi:hypothetical protein